jgi:sugar O-acyltransferase (sialic acid O-acetyltransferase NeuD family)
MQDIVIVGAGGLGREVSEWVEDINEARPTFRLLGFLDDDASRHGERCHDVTILGGVDWIAGQSRGLGAELGVVVAIGSPAAKRRVIERLRAAGVTRFPPVVHPRAILGRFVELGEGTIVCPGAILTTDVRIGRFVALNFDLTVGHDARVDDYALLAPGVHVSGRAHVGEGCDLGAGVVVLPSAAIGPWSIVGAGATVTGPLPANCTAVGTPARPIKTRPDGWHLQ